MAFGRQSDYLKEVLRLDPAFDATSLIRLRNQQLGLNPEIIVPYARQQQIRAENSQRRDKSLYQLEIVISEFSQGRGSDLCDHLDKDRFCWDHWQFVERLRGYWGQRAEFKKLQVGYLAHLSSLVERLYQTPFLFSSELRDAFSQLVNDAKITPYQHGEEFFEMVEANQDLLKYEKGWLKFSFRNFRSNHSWRFAYGAFIIVSIMILVMGLYGATQLIW